MAGDWQVFFLEMQRSSCKCKLNFEQFSLQSSDTGQLKAYDSQTAQNIQTNEYFSYEQMGMDLKLLFLRPASMSIQYACMCIYKVNLSKVLEHLKHRQKSRGLAEDCLKHILLHLGIHTSSCFLPDLWLGCICACSFMETSAIFSAKSCWMCNLN